MGDGEERERGREFILRTMVKEDLKTVSLKTDLKADLKYNLM